MLNSAGNIVGMMPKNFLIVLIENHHWVDVKKLTKEQRMKLKTMYASVENIQMDQNLLRATTRRFTTKKGVVGPQDWYLKEFSRETLQYFKHN